MEAQFEQLRDRLLIDKVVDSINKETLRYETVSIIVEGKMQKGVV
jgi:hypothetical protein